MRPEIYKINLSSMYNMVSRVRFVRRAGGKKKNVRPRNMPRARGRPTLASLVAKVMKGQSETKYVSNAYEDSTTPFAINWSAPINLSTVNTYHPALPALGQGVGDYQRVGNKVMPTKLYTDLTVGYQATDISCNEVIVTIYYGTTKAGKTWQASTPIQSAGDLLDNGDGTTSSFSGIKSDLLYPINKAMNNARQITFRLGKSEGLLNPSGALLQGGYATSNGGSFKKLRLNFKPPKSLVYDQTAYVWPSNYAPWYAISFTRVDDIQTSSIDEGRINVSSLNHMYFKDV